MKNAHTRSFCLALIMACLTFVPGSAANAQTAKRIGMRQAREIAARRAEGLKLRSKDLKDENGRTFYSFRFKDWNGFLRQVNVDAYTGSVISVTRVDPYTKKSIRD